MNLKDMLCETSLSQKGTICFYLFGEHRVVEFMETENGMVITRGWGERNGLLFNKYNLSSWKSSRNGWWW